MEGAFNSVKTATLENVLVELDAELIIMNWVIEIISDVGASNFREELSGAHH